MDTFTLSRTTRISPPELPYSQIKVDLLGQAYVLNLVFIGSKRARLLNRTYRNKNTIPNILTFPLKKNVGEMYICLEKAKANARHSKTSIKNYVCFLFIHGLLHLKNLEHGDEMERLEDIYVHRYMKT